MAFDCRGRLGNYRERLGNEAQRSLTRAAQAAGLDATHELSLILCDSPWIRQVNRKWRGIDRPTDVLSFPLHELRPGQTPPAGAVGDIVICLPVLRREARRLDVDAVSHMRLLLVHGLLHLLGHDHDIPSHKARMQRRERELLEAIQS